MVPCLVGVIGGRTGTRLCGVSGLLLCLMMTPEKSRPSVPALVRLGLAVVPLEKTLCSTYCGLLILMTWAMIPCLFPIMIGSASLALNMLLALPVLPPVLIRLVCMLLYSFTAPGVVKVLTLMSEDLQATAALSIRRAVWPVPMCSLTFRRNGRQQVFTLRHLLQLGMPLLLMLYGLRLLLWLLHLLDGLGRTALRTLLVGVLVALETVLLVPLPLLVVVLVVLLSRCPPPLNLNSFTTPSTLPWP